MPENPIDTAAALDPVQPTQEGGLYPPDHPRAASLGEVWTLAWPLIVSNSFWTLQITIDRVMISKISPDGVSAIMMMSMLFWMPFVLLQTTTSYVTTFVAQYNGANRPERVGPVTWQAIYFAIFAGVGFLGFLPFTADIVRLLDHPESLAALDRDYFRCLCWMALPALLLAAINGFFAGRGESRTVMKLNFIGFIANAFLDWVLIFGKFGFEPMGILGAGIATVIATWIPALIGLGWMLAPKFRETYAMLNARFDPKLFGRLMKFGIPSGLQWTLDVTAFTMLMTIIGWFGSNELGASSIAFTINTTAFLPMLGVGQAVSVLVGQRLGQERPDLAERSTYTAYKLAWCYMSAIALIFVVYPSAFTFWFQPTDEKELAKFMEIVPLIHTILIFIAVYCLFDSMSLVFSFALRGAGDTRFVTLVSLVLSWPMMVIPSWCAYRYNWGMYWAWGFASLYIITLAVIFLMRFRTGKWRSMRVIEPVMIDLEPISAESQPIVETVQSR